MQALVFDGTLRLVHDYPPPLPPAGEALIRVELAGICNTDLEIVRGYAGYRGILGHEFVGSVVESPDTSLIGQRVVGEINAACGDCFYCQHGLPTHCAHRTVLGIVNRPGVMAEYLTLPVANLHVVPAGLRDEQAVFTEPLAAALEVLQQVHIRPTSRVIVLGDGKLGLLVAQVVALTGCDLTLIGHHARKLAIAQRRGIAVRLAQEPLPQPADIVVECTGRAEGFALAQELVHPRGTIVLKSTFHGNPTVNLSALTVQEVSVVGSRCGPFDAALRLLVSQRVETDALIDRVYPLSESLAAFRRAQEPGVLKVLLRPKTTAA